LWSCTTGKDDAVHVGAHLVRLGRDAVLKHTVRHHRGSLVRASPTVTTRQGRRRRADRPVLADAAQHLEHRTFIDTRFQLPQQRGLQGRAAGRGAHTVWIGDGADPGAAEGTNTYELNRNLVLTDGARADSVPNLEI